MKCEEQTWQQKHIGLEASGLRERLLDSHYGLCRIDQYSVVNVIIHRHHCLLYNFVH